MSSDSFPSAYFGSVPYPADEEDRIAALLRLHLSKEEISSRAGHKGARYNYVEAGVGINLANSIFNFDGWSSSVQDVTVDFVDETKDGRWCVGVSVILRVTLLNGAYHEDIGWGQCMNMPDKGQAIEKAKKEGVTDAMKRALRLFGNKLGLTIGDKEYMKKLQSGQIKSEPLDLDNPRKKQRLEDSFNAATAPPPPLPTASPTQPQSPQSYPAPPATQSPPIQSSSTLPNRPPFPSNGRPQPPRNPFSTPAPPPPTTSAPSHPPLGPFQRQQMGGGGPVAIGGAEMQKPRPLAAVTPAGKENLLPGAAGNPQSSPHLNGPGPPTNVGDGTPHWEKPSGPGGYPPLCGPPLPLPSISGIITSLQQPSSHLPSSSSSPSSSQMPSSYAPPTSFTVKQEFATAVSSMSHGMPPPSLPQSRSVYAPQSLSIPPAYSPPAPNPYASMTRPHQPFTSSATSFSIDSPFPALPSGLPPTPPRANGPALPSNPDGSPLPPSSPHPSSHQWVPVSPINANGAPTTSGHSLLNDTDDEDDTAFLDQLILNTNNAHTEQQHQQYQQQQVATSTT